MQNSPTTDDLMLTVFGCIAYCIIVHLQWMRQRNPFRHSIKAENFSRELLQNCQKWLEEKRREKQCDSKEVIYVACDPINRKIIRAKNFNFIFDLLRYIRTHWKFQRYISPVAFAKKAQIIFPCSISKWWLSIIIIRRIFYVAFVSMMFWWATFTTRHCSNANFDFEIVF